MKYIKLIFDYIYNELNSSCGFSAVLNDFVFLLLISEINQEDFVTNFDSEVIEIDYTFTS